MAGNAQNIRLGPCRVIWGVEDLGFTKGGVEVSITSTQVSITSDQFGETPMDKYVTSRTVNVKVPLIETIPGKLDLILNGGDGTAELATVQTVAGLSMRNASQSLVLHPLSKADDDYSEDFVVIRAGVIPNIEATYDSDNERVWSVTFTSFPYYGEFGDIMEADRSGVVVYGGRSAVVANGGLYRASKRSTIGTYFDKNGVMQTANAYVTRPNYVYQNGVWKQKGWLLEPQATNLCWVDTTSAIYTSTNANGFGEGINSYTFTPTSSTASTIKSATQSSKLQVGTATDKPGGADGTQSCLSIFMKKSMVEEYVMIHGNWYFGPTQNLNLLTGQKSYGPPQGDIFNVEDYDDWWKLIWIWEVAGTDCNALFNISTIPSSDNQKSAATVEIAGAQWEIVDASTPYASTSYIPTTSASVTRAAD